MNKKIVGIAVVAVVALCCGVALVFAPPPEGRGNPWELRLTVLESQMTELQAMVGTLESRVDTLETELLDLAMAHSYRFKPDFESDWQPISAGTSLQIDADFPNQFWDGRILFHVMGRTSGATDYEWHQYNLGSDTTSSGDELGVEITEVTEDYLVVRRGAQDTQWDEIQVFGWYLPKGTE